ncbi:hypothetical protein EJ05DRAFT_204917 [Pseudovirgaria hyperparasitica]|uniref:Glutamyl-tRNA amidotransferase complex subunit Gta3 domain-containing protein n=1 Tax=Pseudovirgaria hyperparasitica TaxID=470096 RepID=A0A6A6WJA8_9PEZI|nr:uncharacterized protein EJ05DRAFT_204917 [Pseudovirgaria hyperparasitica]KAF2762314.1 hypothetical protein EJ05DRAFT_204917 [Pseudovirgaria hyperparasitica]
MFFMVRETTVRPLFTTIRQNSHVRQLSTVLPLGSEILPRIDVTKLLATPTWSVRAILPSTSAKATAPAITSAQLHHLLRLSALPLPASDKDEQDMMQALESHIHFVKDIQRVETNVTVPLRALRDESEAAELRNTIDMGALKEALENEEVIGKHHKRIRRRCSSTVVDTWNVTGYAERIAGKHFVVHSEKLPGS